MERTGDFMSLFSYTEVYSTLNMEQFFRAKNALSENNIPFKNTTKSNQPRGGFGRDHFHNAFAPDRIPNMVYSLAVKREYVQLAENILRSL